MRIIAGKYGGRILKLTGTEKFHPMGERIRNAIFNKLGQKVIGAQVLDAFAGTGAVGIEALSRGAQSCLFIEKNRLTVQTLRRNLDILDVEGSQVIQATVLQFLQTSQTNPQTFDLIFADPPYRDLQNSSIKALITRLKPDGILVLSNPKTVPTLTCDGLRPIDERTYADAKIIFYRRAK